MNEKKNETTNSESKIPYFPRTGDLAFCLRCEKPVSLMSFDDAAAFYKTTISEIAALTETGKLHRIHNRRGEVLICSNSLFTEFNQCETRKLDMKMLPRLA